MVERLDIFDLKIVPLSKFHIAYLTRKIENAELISNVQEFEDTYDRIKKQYPIANNEQLNSLKLFMETEKQGFISARITTMFELLRDFRSFTLCQLEFRYSCEDKKKINQILNHIPLLLSRSALTRRLLNSGHININSKENSETFFSFHDIFTIGQKLGYSNMENECRILRAKHPKLFKNRQFDTWTINSSNVIRQIIECSKFNEKTKEEMIAKLLGACYNTDRYLRYKTNHPVNEMNLMGSYYTDSMYSYKIKRVRKSKIDNESHTSKRRKPRTKSFVVEKTSSSENSIKTPSAISNLPDDKQKSIPCLRKAKSNFDLSQNIENDKNCRFSTIETSEFMLEGFDVLDLVTEKEEEFHDYVSSFTLESNSVHCLKLVPDEADLNKIFDECSNELREGSLLKINNSSSNSTQTYMHEERTQQWTVKEANDHNLQITLKRMSNIGWNAESFFTSDELTILKTFVEHMNLSKQYPGKTLNVIESEFEEERQKNKKIFDCENGAVNQLVIHTQSEKISSVKLNDQLLKSNFWEMIHQVYSWFMTDNNKKFIDEKTSKDIFLKSFIKEFELHTTKVRNQSS